MQIGIVRFSIVALLLLALTPVRASADYTVHVVEPAVTDHLILPDGPLPPVCRTAARLRISGCRGEYEPASFVVTASKPLKDVRIEVEPLTGAGGTWPAEAVDVRVVKAYYRSTPAGPPAAVPELLVYDDTILSIEPDPTPEDSDRMKNVGRVPIRDAARLQPLTIEKRRQFWVTVHIPDRAEAGTYRAVLHIVPADGDPTRLELEVEVHPFELLAPMFEYSIYYPVRLVKDGEQDWQSGGWRSLALLSEAQYRAELRNMLAHGLSNPNIYQGVGLASDGSLKTDGLEKILQLREAAGIGPGVPLYTMTAAGEVTRDTLTDEQKAERARIVCRVMDWARGRGYPDFYWAGQDEAWGEWLASERDGFQAIHDGGGRNFVACGTDFFPLIGDVLHRPVMHVNIADPLVQHSAAHGWSPPESLRRNAEIASIIGFERQVEHETYRRSIDGTHRLGRRILTYTTLRPSMPQWQRRYEGLGLWRVGFDGVMNWAYCHIVSEPVDQAMHFAMVFRVDGGVLDTLKWEGFREGVDDVRYLTTLLATLNDVLGRFPGHPLIAETHQWLRDVDVVKGDLDGIRREMARRIVALLDLGHRDLTPEEALADIDIDRIDMTMLPGPWRFKLVELDQPTMLRPDVKEKDDGLKGRWFDPDLDDSAWVPGNVGSGYTLGSGGGWGDEPGFGWYRTRLSLTAAQQARKFKYLHFDACDEDACVYLNGKLVLEHSLKSTGMMTSEIWLAPFVVPLNDGAPKGHDALAVRVRNTEGMGGIWKPVRLVVSDQKLSPQQVKALVTVRTRPADGQGG